MISLRQLLGQPESALEKKKFAEAIPCSPGPSGSMPTTWWANLGAVYLLETGAAARRPRPWRPWCRPGSREAILYLSLADIYQHRLGDRARAPPPTPCGPTWS